MQRWTEITRRRNEALARHVSQLILGLSVAAVILFVWRRLTPIIVSLAGLSGCVAVAPVPFDGPPASEILTANELAPGDYWVEAGAEELTAFALPGGDDGAWVEVDDARSGWFAGAGVYRLDGEQAWSRVSVAEGQMLDDVIQIWDAPR